MRTRVIPEAEQRVIRESEEDILPMFISTSLLAVVVIGGIWFWIEEWAGRIALVGTLLMLLILLLGINIRVEHTLAWLKMLLEQKRESEQRQP